ncbi:MAG: hypothetical protein KGQ59_10075, partial [Bdellovibrionales bacterium]|nr:hypothetical protein [Bdellovibrionales bacterium]
MRSWQGDYWTGAGIRGEGFSLLELVIVLGVMAVVVLGTVEALRVWGKNSLNFKVSSEKTSELQQQGAAFASWVESAGIALFYQHLPIPFQNCADNGPCIRSLVSTNRGSSFVPLDATQKNKLAALKAGGAPMSSIEFFRDEGGELVTDPSRSNNRKSPAIQVPADLLSSGIHATWPLYDESSSTFVVLRENRQFSDYFIFDQNFATSAPSSDRLTLFQRKGGALSSLANLKNTLMLIYNGRNPEQYGVQIVSQDVTVCKTKSTIDPICRTIIENRGLNPNVGWDEHVAIALEPVGDKFATNYSPGISGITPTVWGNQSI